MKQLNDQWLLIHFEDREIFYNPLSGEIRLDYAKNKQKIISKKAPTPFFPEQKINFLYLFPTSDCNLRCIYCYASAGESKKYLDFETAKVAIDYMFENHKKFKTGFHGGGEPLMNFDLVRRATEYIREFGGKMDINLMTNGVFSEEKIRWAAENMNNITFSFDGYPEIQNRQRPAADNSGTYDKVLKSIRIAQETGVRYGVRSTITSYSVNKMLDIVKHFYSLGITNIKLEPVFQTGRFEKNNLETLDLRIFADEFLKALDFAIDHGINLISTFSNVKNIRDTYCGACGSTLGVTPDGHISSCVEVSSIMDPAAEFFIYGEIKDGKVVINNEKLEKLRMRKVDNLSECKNCALRYNCSGGCPVKAFKENGTIFSINKARCETRKYVIEEQVKMLVKKELVK